MLRKRPTPGTREEVRGGIGFMWEPHERWRPHRGRSGRPEVGGQRAGWWVAGAAGIGGRGQSGFNWTINQTIRPTCAAASQPSLLPPPLPPPAPPPGGFCPAHVSSRAGRPVFMAEPDVRRCPRPRWMTAIYPTDGDRPGCGSNPEQLGATPNPGWQQPHGLTYYSHLLLLPDMLNELNHTALKIMGFYCYRP